MDVQVVVDPTNRTESYEYYKVVRRGGSIQLVCRSNCSLLNSYQHFNVEIKNYNSTLTLNSNNPNFLGWSIKVREKKIHLGQVTFKLSLPTNCNIGYYTAFVHFGNSPKLVGSFSFVVVFNPYHKDDPTYNGEMSHLNEYLVNDWTQIYMGTASYTYGKSWYLGQYKKECMAALLLLLKKIDSRNYKCPILMSRALSALVNSNDENGVLYGNWTNDTTGGTSPLAWSGSIEILRKYARNGIPVRFAQCWVYAGVLCTLCRCIGIACRVITAYGAFHDGDESLEWEIYYDEHLNNLNSGRDSIWNFHCWNEVWLHRSDIGSNYSGWQIIDGTPQERSNGIFRVGPTSRVAVKEGLVNLDYDTKFVFAEVNADKVHYRRSTDGNFYPFKIEKGKVSIKMCTKPVDSNKYRDITSDYKYKDGSEMDRVIDSRISKYLKRKTPIIDSHSLLSTSAHNSSLTILCDNYLNFGQSFKFAISLIWSNDVDDGRILVNVMFTSTRGKILATIYKETIKVSAKKVRKEITLSSKDISKNYIKETNSICIQIFFSSSSHSRPLEEQAIVYLKKPSLKMSFGAHSAVRYRNLVINITLVNTTNKKIKNGKLYVESSCLSKRVGMAIGVIHVGETGYYQIVITPTLRGNHMVTAYLDSEYISGFHTTQKLTVY